MKIVLLHNIENKNTNLFKEFCFYLANSFGLKNQKVLYLSTSFNYEKNEQFKNSKTKTIKPFLISEFNSNLHILNFLTPEAKNIKINNPNDILFVLKKQIKMLEKHYDLLVVGLLNQWTELDQFFINLNTNHYFYFLNAKDDLIFPLSFLQHNQNKKSIIFANYSPLSKSSNNNLKQFRLTYQNSISVYVINELNSSNELVNSELVEQILQ